MIIIHPNDEELQDYALNSKCRSETIEHIRECTKCSLKVANYKLIFAEIVLQETPVFDFDLNKLVIGKLPKQNIKYSFEKYFSFIAAGIIVLTFVSLLYFLINKFSTLKPLVICLTIITATFVTVFLAIDMYKKYNDKINTLNFY